MTKKSRRFRWLTGLALAVLALLLIAVGTGLVAAGPAAARNWMAAVISPN
ncbi:hypothetical protein [Rhodanobacter sp. 115]|nr:hypothetical protein [Rhodanobacter sp. 115]